MRMDQPSQVESAHPSPSPPIHIAILAGGASRRMGRDKKGLTLGGSTYLQRVCDAARATGRQVHVIERDVVPHSGPLSGIATAMRLRPGSPFLFLPCDIPLVTTSALQSFLGQILDPTRAYFLRLDGFCGFPFHLPATAVESVESHLRAGEYSLQKLAAALDPLEFSCGERDLSLLANINTPEEHQRISSLWPSGTP